MTQSAVWHPFTQHGLGEPIPRAVRAEGALVHTADGRAVSRHIREQREALSLAALFAEEIGVVIQIRRSERTRVMDVLRAHGLSSQAHEIGGLNPRDAIEIYRDAKCIFSAPRTSLQTASVG